MPAGPAAAVIYGAALLQGLAMVSFPASAPVLKAAKGFTDAQYGLIFLPQIVTTILGSLVGGSLAAHVGLKRLLGVALVCTAASQAALAIVARVPNESALGAALLATALFGLGFGAIAAPINTLPGLIFPRRADAALVALHTVLGGGLAIGPALAAKFIGAGAWVGFPMTLLAASALLLLVSLAVALPTPAAQVTPAGGTAARGPRPLGTLALWLFSLMVVFYAFAEGTFANWSVIYLSEEKQIPLPQAALALSVFWAMMAFGRLVASVLLLHLPAPALWLTHPALMLVAFLLLPSANSALSGILLFAFAGLACSSFFPITVGLASRRFAADAPFVSSLMIAALMTGVGIGSYVIGPLRASMPLVRLYQLSAAYPAGALALALLLLGRGDVRLREEAQA